MNRVDEAPSSESALVRIGRNSFSPRFEAVVVRGGSEELALPKGGGAAGRAEIVRYETEQVEIEAECGSACLLSRSAAEPTVATPAAGPRRLPPMLVCSLTFLRRRRGSRQPQPGLRSDPQPQEQPRDEDPRGAAQPSRVSDPRVHPPLWKPLIPLNQAYSNFQQPFTI